MEISVILFLYLQDLKHVQNFFEYNLENKEKMDIDDIIIAIKIAKFDNEII